MLSGLVLRSRPLAPPTQRRLSRTTTGAEGHVLGGALKLDAALRADNRRLLFALPLAFEGVEAATAASGRSMLDPVGRTASSAGVGRGRPFGLESGVLGLGHDLQVRRVAAQAVAAGVVDDHAIGDGAVCGGPDNPMYPCGTPAVSAGAVNEFDCHDAVTGTVRPHRPLPAPGLGGRRPVDCSLAHRLRINHIERRGSHDSL